MRWNAYTMTLGYVRGSYRADRAKVHNKLCAWDDLSKIDKHKNKHELKNILCSASTEPRVGKEINDIRSIYKL